MLRSSVIATAVGTMAQTWAQSPAWEPEAPTVMQTTGLLGELADPATREGTRMSLWLSV